MQPANTSSLQSTSSSPDTLPAIGSEATEEFLRALSDATDLAWVDWLEQLQQNGSSLFKLDVTFDYTGTTASADSWLEYFDTHVVYRVNKSLGRPRKNKRPPTIVNASAREYEFDIKTAGYKGADWRCPAHIHSIVAVPNKFAQRMMSARVKTDIESLQKISSVHIEFIPTHDPAGQKTLLRAYFYMRKRKTFRPLS